MKIKANIVSQIMFDNRRDFDVIVETVDGKHQVLLQCLDKHHALALARMVGKCVNYCENYAVLHEPERK